MYDLNKVIPVLSFQNFNRVFFCETFVFLIKISLRNCWIVLFTCWEACVGYSGGNMENPWNEWFITMTKFWLHVVLGHGHGKFCILHEKIYNIWNMSAPFRFWLLHGKILEKFPAALKFSWAMYHIETCKKCQTNLKTCKTSMQARLGLPVKLGMMWLHDAMQFILWPYNRSLVNSYETLYELHVIRLQDRVRPSCFFFQKRSTRAISIWISVIDWSTKT